MNIANWIIDNYIEVFGAITGIIYVFLEIRQTIWLWPLGIITSILYILVFFSSKFYADAGLQFYYLFISFYGWYWWEGRSTELRAQGSEEEERSVEHRAESSEKEEKIGDLTGADPLLGGVSGGSNERGEPRAVSEDMIGLNQPLIITRLKMKTGLILSLVFAALFAVMWYILDNFTDSPVPGWDSFITSLSIVATWMLARKILEHWILWIVVDIVSVFIYATKGLYPTVLLFIVYSTMAFYGLFAWRKIVAEQVGRINQRVTRSSTE